MRASSSPPSISKDSEGWVILMLLVIQKGGQVGIDKRGNERDVATERRKKRRMKSVGVG